MSGDRYAAEWVVSAFGEHGITYAPSDKSKSELYLEALPLFTRGAISIPDYAPLVRELRLLERQTHRGGRDTMDTRGVAATTWRMRCVDARLLPSSNLGFDTTYASFAARTTGANFSTRG